MGGIFQPVIMKNCLIVRLRYLDSLHKVHILEHQSIFYLDMLEATIARGNNFDIESSEIDQND